MNRIFTDKDIKKLIIPLLLEQTLLITVGMADTVMISSVGEAAVSGVSLVDMLNNLIISVLAALATGGAVVSSQYLGAKERNRACDAAKQLVYVAAVITIGIAVLVAVLQNGIISLLFGKIEEDVFQNAKTYLGLSAISFPFIAIYNACAALFRSMGNSRVTFRVSVLMNMINVAGNALCIFGLHMGVAGVAIPTIVSRMVAAVMLYLLLKDKSREIYIPSGMYKPDMYMIHRIFYIGIPSGIENGLFQLGRVLVVSIIAGFGTVQIAANGVANSLDSMGCIVGGAMGLAMITVIGQCVGAGDIEQVRYYTKKLMKITYFFTILVNVVILSTLHWSLKAYGLSEETTRLSYILVMIHNGTAMALWPASFVLPNMLRACNDVRYPMVISIFSMVTFRIGLSVVFGIYMGYGAIGVWLAMVVDWIFRTCCFVGRYMAGTWVKTAGQKI